VARDAIVDTGLEQHVFVVEGADRFVPRRVQVGGELGDRVEVRAGLAENEQVVASGVFLIDSESRLRASGGGAMAGMKMDSDEGAMPTTQMDSKQEGERMPGMKMDSNQSPAVPAPARDHQQSVPGMRHAEPAMPGMKGMQMGEGQAGAPEP
jgi:hypothetical protein